MSFICHNCGSLFEEPEIEENGFGHSFGYQKYNTARCPECGDTNFDVATICTNCKGCEVDGDNVICKDCRDYLDLRFEKFLNTLTEKEIEQLDICLDGNSIKEVKKWKLISMQKSTSTQ